MRLLILGGTGEGRRLAEAVAGDPAVAATVSLAGRTGAPLPVPVPTRSGGFGGADGLAAFLAEARVGAVVDATHPFAERITRNARDACSRLGLPLARFTRPPWAPCPGDRWTSVPTLAAAAAALGPAPRRVFLTTGRLGLAAFRAAPGHDYLVRSIDPPDDTGLPPRCQVVLARGPFDADAEEALMRQENVEVLVTKNSGGPAGAGKIAAARRLGLPVVMVERPSAAPDAALFHDLPAVLGWIAARHRGAP